MPRLYLTPAEFQESSLGQNAQVSTHLSSLNVGVLDKMLARASQRCDTYTKRRLQAPGSTTLTTGPIAGATSLSVASTLTLDEKDEQAMQIGTGTTQETVLIRSGGVTITTWTSPYPGIIMLDTPLQFGHASGEPVVFLYKEVSEAGSASNSDPYTEALETQVAQLALAHLPPTRNSLTRVIFTKNYPIIALRQIEHAYSFTNEFNNVDMTVESVVGSEGWFRLNVGTVVLREGLIRTTYTGGFQAVPDDIKEACSLFVAEQIMQYVNPFSVQQITMGKRTQKWGTSVGKTPLAIQAEDMLKRYRKMM